MLIYVTVHGATVILSVAKNLVRDRGAGKILRYAQNDDVFPTRERLPTVLKEQYYRYVVQPRPGHDTRHGIGRRPLIRIIH